MDHINEVKGSKGVVTVDRIRSAVDVVSGEKTQDQRDKLFHSFVKLYSSPEVSPQDIPLLRVNQKEQEVMGM